MKALKVLGIVFGILLLLTGGGLLVGSALVDQGQSALVEQMRKSGFDGPVDGVVKSIDQTSPVVLTVNYTDKAGQKRTGQGASTGQTPPAVGSTVTVFYSTDDPTQIGVVDLKGLGTISSLGSTLRTGAIVCLVAGGVLLLAGILGFVFGKKKPKPLAPSQQPPAGGQPPTAPPGTYPPQQPPAGYPQAPPPGYPQQQPPSNYPPQQPPPGYPPQGYPQQQPPANYPPQQPPPGYPPQGGGYPPQPGGYPPQQPPAGPPR